MKEGDGEVTDEHDSKCREDFSAESLPKPHQIFLCFGYNIKFFKVHEVLPLDFMRFN